MTEVLKPVDHVSKQEENVSHVTAFSDRIVCAILILSFRIAIWQFNQVLILSVADVWIILASDVQLHHIFTTTRNVCCEISTLLGKQRYSAADL